MARLASNVERYLSGASYHYIAYDAQGFAFRLVKLGDGSWYARPSHIAHAGDYRTFGADTLTKVAAKVAASSREGK